MRKCNLDGKEQFVNYSFEVNGHSRQCIMSYLGKFGEKLLN